MSVVVDSITKIYGTQKALDQVSFKVEPGQVVGFLGPNGAGKSTMMKIISCFIPQTDGKVTVEGFDVNSDPLEVRRRVGYLPEHNPLYLDMYVKEFLLFIGQIQLSRHEALQRTREMIELTGLGPEQNKKISELSKGYRQRVGLAQSMIHAPGVLILDEPTTGLDPNQLVEIRNLIRNIGREKTVILSTHIMQEVEAICNRVIIINKGKIVADEDTSRLRAQAGGRNVIRVEFDKEVEAAELSSIPGVLKVRKEKDKTWALEGAAEADIRQELFRFAVDRGLSVLMMQKEENNLETVFRQLTVDK
ncbi:MAG: gliding motility-associated ABC transporter ATP-binding subunit GldA [Bacteroidia bacterium]|nr:gliding motility-associated ABC transporter ATP-binding subunit GldA [Bacteroidia bacterium]